MSGTSWATPDDWGRGRGVWGLDKEDERGPGSVIVDKR